MSAEVKEKTIGHEQGIQREEEAEGKPAEPPLQDKKAYEVRIYYTKIYPNLYSVVYTIKSIFYDFVRKLNEINPDKINLNYNIIHGREYSINIYGEKYTINLSTNDRSNPEAIKYFNLFDSVWELYGKGE